MGENTPISGPGFVPGAPPLNSIDTGVFINELTNFGLLPDHAQPEIVPFSLRPESTAWEATEKALVPNTPQEVTYRGTQLALLKTYGIIEHRLDSSLSLPVRRCALLFVGLQGRMTSRRDDEAVCLANLMGIDPLPIVQASTPNQRMKALLLALGKIPGHILFNPDPRIEERGWRWAPQSFLNMGRYLNMENTRTARVHELGLVLRSPGIQLRLNDSVPDEADISVSIGDRVYHLHLRIVDDEGAIMRSNRWKWFHNTLRLELCLIVGGVPQETFSREGAAIVSLEEEADDGEILFVDYWRYVEIEAGFEVADEDKGPLRGEGEWIPGYQKWCIA